MNDRQAQPHIGPFPNPLHRSIAPSSPHRILAPPEVSVCTACVGEPAQEAAPPKGRPSSIYEVPLSAQGSGHRTEVAAGSFTVVLDAGRALGGQETGPSPVQAFVSSIVGCSQITLQLVAHDAGVQLGDIAWTAHGVFDTRRLLGSRAADASPRFHSIAITGTVAADVPQSKLDALAESTEARCPISQSLHPDVSYSLSLVRAADIQR
ncbi:osmotically inducible C [Chlorella sorokiniana]|uniref:Osmotically inducible C n=1 Tax=Chlorella sorokiniana TaxID=3076 RepID=A0A2P6U1D7_CHLSO|nr:osmotically inducible C [Chlorella sorokiniana]|eukprot:PRW60131.1 osmotically inducible C [Chlorella sorokiniana]